jgi:predicted phosphodiesterase
VGQAQEAENIADEMATDYGPGAGGVNPAFLFHLGDVIYGPDKAAHYGDRFYRPYRHYPGKIIAIPGNHDGEVKSPVDDPSLKDFIANFCAPEAVVPQAASDSGIYRETMTQPGIYWMLDAPFARIIGLYSNRLENPGYLQGTTKGHTDLAQIQWLQKTLTTIAKAKDKKALIIATHHPPYSQSGHSGSQEMNQTIDDACTKAGVTPDLFLSGHAHNFQRYTRHIDGKQVPYIVVGTGGMPPQPVVSASGQPVGGNAQLTYDSAVSSYGYLYVTVSSRQVKIEFWQLGQQHTRAFNTAILDLETHVVS